MSEEEIVVVDEKDKVIGHKPRNQVDAENLRYRVAALWITNSKGEILLARRAYNKAHDPGKWGPAAAGTVSEGESYLETMMREAREELGLENIALKVGPKVKGDGQHKYFGQWFSCTSDKPAEAFKIQSEEVAELKWFSKQELEKQLKENPSEFLKNIRMEMDLLERIT
jgi:isopentenyl-diphosphate delta-isomerase